MFSDTLAALCCWVQHVEDCPAAHEGGLKDSRGTEVLHPSQCIYSNPPPTPFPRYLPLHTPSLVSPTHAEFKSPPRLQEK